MCLCLCFVTTFFEEVMALNRTRWGVRGWVPRYGPWTKKGKNCLTVLPFLCAQQIHYSYSPSNQNPYFPQQIFFRLQSSWKRGRDRERRNLIKRQGEQTERSKGKGVETVGDYSLEIWSIITIQFDDFDVEFRGESVILIWERGLVRLERPGKSVVGIFWIPGFFLSSSGICHLFSILASGHFKYQSGYVLFRGLGFWQLSFTER